MAWPAVTNFEEVPAPAPLSVVRGFTYTDHRQLLNRRLVPSYQAFYRWTGSAADAEDATRWLFEAVVAPIRLPALVEDVNGRLNRATVEALGRHWSSGYRVTPTSWTGILSRPRLVSVWAQTGLRALLDPLPGELRTLVALRLVRRHPMEAIASRLGMPPAAANLLLFDALAAIGASIGLPEVSATIVQAGLVARFVDDLTLCRRPLRFECAPNALTALLAAAQVQAAVPGNDLPDPRFVRRLAESVTRARN